mgnify:FL=1
MVKAEGWHSKQGAKWASMPGQMFRYRAATFWARVFAPEVSMGIYTADEIEDARPALAIDVTATTPAALIDDFTMPVAETPAPTIAEPAEEKPRRKRATEKKEESVPDHDPATGEVHDDHGLDGGDMTPSIEDDEAAEAADEAAYRKLL